MAAMKLDTITYEEFEKRVEENNERLAQEVEAAQERVRQLDALIARKQAYDRRLTEILLEMEREEEELAAMEKGLRLPRRSASRRAVAGNAAQ